MAGRGENQVVAVGFVHSFGHEVGIEHYGHQLLPVVRRTWQLSALLLEPLLAELGHDFLASVVVVDSVGEPNTLQVGDECLPFRVFRRVVSFRWIVPFNKKRIDGFEQLSDAQIVFSLLVESDVSAVECGLCQAIDKHFLAKIELAERFDLVA